MTGYIDDLIRKEIAKLVIKKNNYINNNYNDNILESGIKLHNEIFNQSLTLMETFVKNYIKRNYIKYTINSTTQQLKLKFTENTPVFAVNYIFEFDYFINEKEKKYESLSLYLFKDSEILQEYCDENLCNKLKENVSELYNLLKIGYKHIPFIDINQIKSEKLINVTYRINMEKIYNKIINNNNNNNFIEKFNSDFLVDFNMYSKFNSFFSNRNIFDYFNKYININFKKMILRPKKQNDITTYDLQKALSIDKTLKTDGKLIRLNTSFLKNNLTIDDLKRAIERDSFIIFEIKFCDQEELNNFIFRFNINNPKRIFASIKLHYSKLLKNYNEFFPNQKEETLNMYLDSVLNFDNNTEFKISDIFTNDNIKIGYFAV